MKKKSVQSINPCNSVILTIYDIVKAQVGEIKVQSLPHRLAGLLAGQVVQESPGNEFIIQLPIV